MSTQRDRLTWAAGRKASAPPATPGYDVEDEDHPAHQPDPNATDYENGDTSSWAEDVRQPPYAQGNPPSIPGYDVEDQDHPAHVKQPRVPKEARSLRDQIKVKASKCLKVARMMLGEFAPDEKIEDQALDLMDLPDEQLTATFNRCSGNPMVADDTFEDAPVTDAELDALLADDMEVEDEGEVEGKTAVEELETKLAELSKELASLKSGTWKHADQNDPKGDTLGAEGKDEEEAREEGAAKKAARAFFASMDTDRDGFVLKAEWLGNKAIFAAADKDEDGIVSEDEVVDELTEKKSGKKAKKSEEEIEDEVEEASDEGDEEEIEEKKAGKKATDEEVEDDEVEEKAAKKKACDACDDADADMFGLVDDTMGLGQTPEMTPEDDELLASVFGKAAKKAEEDEEEVEEKKAGKKAKKSEEELEDEEEVEEKKAGKKAADEDEEVEDEEEKEAQKKAARLAGKTRTASQKPQPRKPATVRTASRDNNVNELSALWETAPDVSDHF